MLKDKYKDYFKIGVAVNNKTIKTHADIIKEHFNSITCENEMKYTSVNMGKGRYNFMDSDEIIRFAKENDLSVRGHTFVWHNQTPNWMFEGDNRKVLLENLKEHIKTIGLRYKDQVFCWDVLNEAVEDKGNNILRPSRWVDILGENIMDDVFRVAREVLPKTELFYNDYNSKDPVKRDKIYQMVKGMKERNVPIDGIGMQCHCNIYGPSVKLLKEAIELYAKLDVKIHITEMDVSLFEFSDHSRINKPSRKLFEIQAKYYADYFRIFREYKDIIDCVTLWGVADDMTWLDGFPAPNRKNWPLLFDEDHKPKEALYRILDF